MAGIRPYRLVLLLLLCAAVLTPLPAAAAPVVGVVMTGNTSYFGEMHQAFVETLEAGSPAGSLPTVLLQRPFPDPVALSNAARKLIAADADIIVTYGTPATLAVLQEKSKIPVIYGGIYDPANARISSPLATGCGYKVPLSSLLRYLRELRQITTLTVIYTSSESDSLRQLEELTRLAVEQQLRLHPINLEKSGDLGRLTSQLAGEAVFLTGAAQIDLWLEPILRALKERGLPSVGLLPDQNKTGVTLTLHQPPRDQGRKVAELTLQVLAGRQPQHILPETLRSTELVFNLKEAKNLGIKIPFHLVAEATRVIK